jgi:predicted RNA-binding protein with PUA-like domain
VCKLAYPDATQCDRKSKYYDPKATSQNPRWFNVDVRLVRKTRLASIKELRSHRELANMRVLQKSNRLYSMASGRAPRARRSENAVYVA